MKNIKNTISYGLLISMLIACKSEKKEIQKPLTTQPEISQTMEKTQTQALEERKNNFNAKADEKTKQIYQEGLDAVVKSGILENAKKVGDKAPMFTLKNAAGKEVALEDYLKDGPVVLVWYRGGWCPYCNINLQYLQQELPNMKAQGANLLALTPELPDQSISTKEKHELEFEVLSDIGNHVAKDYGVVFDLTEEVAEIYNDKFNLNKHNGDNSNQLPLAATYIIDTDGTIKYAFVDADYRNRAEPKEITAFLKTMK